MLIDCDTCAVRDLHCGECVMTVLLQAGDRGVLEVDEAEERALEALADGGLVPRLRLIPLTDPRGRASA
ncbi:MAG: hypothetical protein JWM40_987 [Frankiales bacterium]|nr:hypothetical protein [Frankiales bacterium]